MRFGRVLGPSVGIALAAACSLTNSLDDLRGKDAGSSDSGACSGSVSMSCSTPNFGNASCGSCVSGKCCAEIVSCGNDLGCRALQACVNARCSAPTKACASAECGACFVGDSALLWLALESCSEDCAGACVSEDGGALDANDVPDVQDASEAEASGGCVPQVGKSACAQDFLGVSMSCEDCIHTSCCSQESTCASDAQCWGFAKCTAKYCFGTDGSDSLACSQKYCGGCSGGLSGAANLYLCLQSNCSSQCL